MKKSTLPLILLLLLCGAAPSFGWEVLNEVPAVAQIGVPIELQIRGWMESGDCYVSEGYIVLSAGNAAEVILLVRKTNGWADPCGGPGNIYEYTVEVSFFEVGPSTLTITQRLDAPPLGGDTPIAQYEIEVQAALSDEDTAWGALKAIYR